MARSIVGVAEVALRLNEKGPPANLQAREQSAAGQKLLLPLHVTGSLSIPLTPGVQVSFAKIVSLTGCVYRNSIRGSRWPLISATSGTLKPSSKNRLMAS